MATTVTRTADLPTNAWGDATFHLANAERALEHAVQEAVSRDERMLAARMRRAIRGAHKHTRVRAFARDMSKLGPAGEVLQDERGKVVKGPNFAPPDMTAATASVPSQQKGGGHG
jgi:hypothetical protein